MKRKNYLALAGAIALLGMGLEACSSDDDVAEVSPDYDAVKKAVKTEFALNIASANNTTRMAAAETQQGGTFVGITDAYLFSLGTPAASLQGTTEFLDGGKFLLGNITSEEISSSQSSKIYTLYVPVNTQSFLFYAKADKGSKDGHVAGVLNSSVNSVQTTDSKKPEDINFTLGPILSGSEFGATQTVLKDKLNAILGSHVGDDSNPTSTWKGTQHLAENGTTQQKIDYKAISDAYKSFVKIGSTSIRQGSTFAIVRTVRDLYRALEAIRQNTTAPTEVQAIVTAVETAIKAQFAVIGEGQTATVAMLEGDSDNAKDFPAKFGMPVGSAVLSITPVGATAINDKSYDSFSYVTDGKNAFTSVSTNVEKFDYPSELAYYCQSPVITSAAVHVPGDYPKTVENWNNMDQWGSTWSANSTVTSATRAVAMQNNVTYGTALLVSSLYIEVGDGSYRLTDNANTVTGGEIADQTFTFNANSFEWKGVLVGGQPDQVDWQYLPYSTEMNQVIYDNQINTPAITTTASAVPTYTMVLDNKRKGEGSEDKVYVAVEIKNNSGNDFYGADGLIADGQTFYLVGQLDPASASAGSGNISSQAPVGYPVSTADRVFAQDFKTFANFIIKGESLKRAYSTIPDLRSTQMLFGLSVDLTWKSGLTFNVQL